MRRLLGDTKNGIMNRYFREALLLTTIAFILSLVQVELFLPHVNEMMGTKLTPFSGSTFMYQLCCIIFCITYTDCCNVQSFVFIQFRCNFNKVRMYQITIIAIDRFASQWSSSTDSSYRSFPHVLQQFDFYYRIRTVQINFSKTFTAAGAAPYRWTMWNIVPTHNVFFSIFQNEVNFSHVSSSIYDIDHMATADRAFHRFACYVDDT